MWSYSLGKAMDIQSQRDHLRPRKHMFIHPQREESHVEATST